MPPQFINLSLTLICPWPGTLKRPRLCSFETRLLLTNEKTAPVLPPLQHVLTITLILANYFLHALNWNIRLWRTKKIIKKKRNKDIRRWKRIQMEKIVRRILEPIQIHTNLHRPLLVDTSFIRLWIKSVSTRDRQFFFSNFTGDIVLRVINIKLNIHRTQAVVDPLEKKEKDRGINWKKKRRKEKKEREERPYAVNRFGASFAKRNRRDG